jgi:hypothetical protein
MVIIQEQPPAPSLGFLDLPFEIRRHIYTYLISQKRRFALKWLTEGCGFSLDFYEDFWCGESVGSWAQLSSPIKTNQPRMLEYSYGEKVMEDSLSHLGEQTLNKFISDENRRCIRYLTVMAPLYGMTLGKSTSDISRWALSFRI